MTFELSLADSVAAPEGAVDTLLPALQRLEAFRGLSYEDLVVVAGRAGFQSLRPREVLFKQGEADPWLHCLVDGTIRLRAADGREHQVAAGSPEAGRFISRLKPRRYTATAVTPVKVLRVDASGMGFWHSAVDPDTMMVEEVAELEWRAATGEAQQEPDEQDYELPTLPAIAFRARELIDRDECDIDTVARLVMNDPSMAAKLIKAANSPVFYGTQPVGTCDRAIVRLGLKTARQLIIAFAMREVFDIGAPELQDVVTELWNHSTEVAAIACVIARRTRAFDAGEAQLAGLLHDLGVIPVLSLVSRSPEMSGDPEVLMTLIRQQRAEMGRAVLEAWNFPPPLAEAAAQAEDWWRESSGPPDMTDLVIVSQLLSFIGNRRIVDVPPVVKVPAFSRILGEGFGPDDALALLKEAASEIESLRQLLRS